MTPSSRPPFSRVRSQKREAGDSVLSLASLRRRMREAASPAKAAILKRFFKTGPGEYGEGDVFIGLPVPQIRAFAKAAATLSFPALREFLQSTVHEERLLGFLVLVDRYEKGSPAERKRVFNFYFRHLKHLNNWDLIDLTAPKIVGAFLQDKPKEKLWSLAASSVLWHRRVAIVASHHEIRRGAFSLTLGLAQKLLHDKEDLIHKAVGWMLREVGKRDRSVLQKFLNTHASTMPRTMLRYAIEHFPEPQRRFFLNK